MNFNFYFCVKYYFKQVEKEQTNKTDLLSEVIACIIKYV